MAHLTPKEILARAEEFLQTADYTVQNGLYPRNFSTWLTNAYRLRNFAQYHFDPPQVKKIRRVVNHAKEVIHKVGEVIK